MWGIGIAIRRTNVGADVKRLLQRGGGFGLSYFSATLFIKNVITNRQQLEFMKVFVLLLLNSSLFFYPTLHFVGVFLNILRW